MTSKIEWLKNPITGEPGYTINPVKGLCPMRCKNLAGYEYCYAAGERGLYKRFKWNPEISWDEQCLLNLSKIKKPSRIFIGSTIELFGNWVGSVSIKYILDYVKDYPQHTFIFLTKQPQRLNQFSPYPANCYIGVSATDEQMFINAICFLRHIEAKVKFISLEPLLSWDTSAWGYPLVNWFNKYPIQQIIIGQQTPVSAKTQPKIEWIREIIESADKAKIPVFLKDNLKGFLPFRQHYRDDFHGKCYELRQEFPK